jgi:hypothetical protein
MRENISPEGGFHDLPRYVHPPINMTEVETPISFVLLMFSGICHFLLLLTGCLLVIGTSSPCTVLFFGRPRYTKIAIARHI